MVMWDEIAVEIAAEFPDVTWDKMLVDAMTMRMVIKPQSIDTVVATNLHADILSDLAAALAGSLGIAPTANLNPERTFPSMFEPIHGSAFDIMGKGIANPVGTFWSAVMMLDHLGEPRRRRPADAGDRARHRRQALPHARSRRLGADRRRHRRRHRRGRGRQRLNKESMMNALSHIRQLDYTVIYARDFAAMRHFYEKVMEFPVINVLSERWVEFGLGSNRLALTVYGGRFKDVAPPAGTLSLQLAFRVPPAEVAKCAELLESRGVEMIAAGDRPAVRPSHGVLPRSRRQRPGDLRRDIGERPCPRSKPP